MTDSISRCELFNKLATIPAPPEANDFKAEVYKVIQQMETTDKWIPCSERLPESQGYYICTFKDGSKYKRASAVKWSNGWQLTGTRSYWTVLAWMPLPEPWKGADDEDA